jgi:sarcosine oxidase subunit delta
MRIPCPVCGERALEEFTYRGDARPTRPPRDGDSADPQVQAAWVDYVYLRANERGRIKELWQHLHGCRAWIVVDRDTATHAVHGSELARDSREGGQA